MTGTQATLAAILLLAWLASRSAPATPKPAAHARLPSTVEKTLQTNFPTGEIVTADATVEGGVTVWDVELTEASIEKHAHVIGDGTLLDVTEGSHSSQSSVRHESSTSSSAR